MTTLVQDTKRSSTFANRSSLGAIALILASVANATGMILSISTSSNPHTEQVQVALQAATFAYRLRLAVAPVYLAFFMLGIVALYAHLSQTKAEKLAFAGLVVSIICIALFLPVIGFAAYVFPAIGNLVRQGQVEMVAVMNETFREPFLGMAYVLGGMLWNIGPILMGAAIWRSGALWKWAGLLLIIQGVVGIPSSLSDNVWFGMIPGMAGVIGQFALGVSLYRAIRTGTDSWGNQEARFSPKSADAAGGIGPIDG